MDKEKNSNMHELSFKVVWEIQNIRIIALSASLVDFVQQQSLELGVNFTIRIKGDLICIKGNKPDLAKLHPLINTFIDKIASSMRQNTIEGRITETN